ncbi:MAG: amidohydrolase [Tenuifilaceae bacterium]|jgi:amidohydrolase|nr:amidohydrolase [Tenuifilaceae bacterium]
MEELVRLRHELHRNPELSGEERATGKRVRFYLNKYRPDELFTGIAGEGMAAVYNGQEPGPTILFRCDMDALPINEAVKRHHMSTVQGVAHVCGHDGHMAIVSGLAAKITHNPIRQGRVILFYQPSEENGLGARRSIDRLKELNLYPHYAFAIHNMPKYPLGNVIIAKDTFAAASKGLIVKLIGKNSHAAYPEKGVNPALAIAKITQELCELTSKNRFNRFVMLTVIHIRLGDVAFGTSPGYGEIMVTLRSFDNDDMVKLSELAISIARSIGVEHGLAVETSIADDYPAAIGDATLSDLVKDIATTQGRPVVTLEEPNRWSEDFANFTQHGPALLFGLGVGEDVPDLHSPEYDFPDEAIELGVDLLDSVVTRMLRE